MTEKTRAKAREYQKLNYDRFKAEYRARALVLKALKNGTLHRGKCEICGDERVEAHHDDYNEPLNVRWLCISCHRKWHSNNEPRRAIFKDRMLECGWCGRIFKPQEKATRYCCNSCKKEAQLEVNRRSYRNNSWKYAKPRDSKVCPICSKSFVPIGCQKYCSQSCANSARKEQKRAEYYRHKDRYAKMFKEYKERKKAKRA